MNHKTYFLKVQLKDKTKGILCISNLYNILHKGLANGKGKRRASDISQNQSKKSCKYEVKLMLSF